MGALILGRMDDGALQVIRADDEIELDEELLDDMPEDGDYRREGKLIKVDGRDESLTYVLTEYHRDTHSWTAVRTRDDGTAR